MVHDTHLPEAQGVLVAFTGDDSIVEYVVETETGWGERDQHGGYAQAATGPMAGMPHLVERIRDAGIEG